MQLDLIFLPLLGGYLFFVRFNGTRYQASKYQAQRVIFPAALFGLIFLIVARLIELWYADVRANASYWIRLVTGDLVATTAALCCLTTAIAAFQDREKLRRHVQDHYHTVFQDVLFFIVAAVIFHRAVSVSGYSIDVLGTVAQGIVLGGGVALFIAVVLGGVANWPWGDLLFRISIAALLMALIFAAIAVHAESFSRDLWFELSTLKASGWPFLAFLLAAPCALLANLIVPLQAASSFLHTRGSMDDLRKLLFKALASEEPVMLTLGDEKVYVGLVKAIPTRVEMADGYFVLLPLSSGYRDKDTKAVRLMTFYDEVYKSIEEEAKKSVQDELAADTPGYTGGGFSGPLVDRAIEQIREERLRTFYRVFRIGDVQSAGIFDSEMYMRFSLKSDRITGDASLAAN